MSSTSKACKSILRGHVIPRDNASVRVSVGSRVPSLRSPYKALKWAVNPPGKLDTWH